MDTVGAYEAKTHLPKLLERVAKGEQFIITKHGVPIAKLSPVSSPGKEEVRKAIEELKAFGMSHSLGGLSIKAMIEEGRR